MLVGFSCQTFNDEHAYFQDKSIWLNGFVKNIVDEKDRDCKDKMLHHLGDCMEDATDFSCSNAKSAHAVLLCEMERGSLDRFNTDQIYHIWCAHAQRHSAPPKYDLHKTTEQTKQHGFVRLSS